MATVDTHQAIKELRDAGVDTPQAEAIVGVVSRLVERAPEATTDTTSNPHTLPADPFTRVDAIVKDATINFAIFMVIAIELAILIRLL